MLRKREGDITVVVVADGPAVRRRHTRHAIEVVVLEGAGAGGADDGPRGPVPALDERLRKTAVVNGEADRPTLGRRHARHAKEVVALCSAGVGRTDDGPRGPIPPLDQGLIIATLNGVAGEVVADSPA